MSVHTIARVLHHSNARGTAKVVLLAIASHDGLGGAWPSVATLARYANVNSRTVQKCIAALVESGELERQLQAGGTPTSHRNAFDRPNRYRILVTCPPRCDQSTNHRLRREPAIVTSASAPTPRPSEQPSDRDCLTPLLLVPSSDESADESPGAPDHRPAPPRKANPAPPGIVSAIRRDLKALR